MEDAIKGKQPIRPFVIDLSFTTSAGIFIAAPTIFRKFFYREAYQFLSFLWLCVTFY